MEGWIEKETLGSKFYDERVRKRFLKVLQQLSSQVGASIPMACQDWGGVKGAYRFLSNSKVKESQILEGHFCSTRKRFSKIEEKVLILHDTTEFSFKRQEPKTIGVARRFRTIRDCLGREITKAQIVASFKPCGNHLRSGTWFNCHKVLDEETI